MDLLPFAGAASALVTGLFLSAVNTKIIDYLSVPLKRRFTAVDFWWLLYVALATGFAISWLSDVNLFGDFIADPTLGRVLSGILVGGGSSLIHDIFNSGASDN